MTGSPLPTVSTAASGTVDGVHPMGTNRGHCPAHLANVERLSAFTARGAPAPRQIEGL